MTVAETLRAWAADADEEMAAPLRELAAQYEVELTAARLETERNVLAPVAEVLGCEAETFALIASANALTAKTDALEAAEAARLKRRETGLAQLAEKKQFRALALEQLIECLTAIRNIDVASPDNDLERAAYERHISDLRATYGRDVVIRD